MVNKRGKLETIPHCQGAPGHAGGNPAPTNAGGAGGGSGPTISEAAYFIQRVNRIL